MVRSETGEKSCLENYGKNSVNYETISYLVCGVLTTAVDFVSYTAFRKMSMGVGVSQALSWVAAVYLLICK